MQVIAFSTPRHPRWRWRITDSSGAVIEESENGFDTISAAVAVGRQRLLSLNAPDPRVAPSRPWGARHYVRGERG